jgi:hypothetical protein
VVSIFCIKSPIILDIEEVKIMEKVKIIYKYVKNLGEEYDDQDNFVGFKTQTLIRECVVDRDKVYVTLETIQTMAADYGDGVTTADVLAVCDPETGEVLPGSEEYWSPDQ